MPFVENSRTSNVFEQVGRAHGQFWSAHFPARGRQPFRALLALLEI